MASGHQLQTIQMTTENISVLEVKWPRCIVTVCLLVPWEYSYLLIYLLM